MGAAISPVQTSAANSGVDADEFILLLACRAHHDIIHVQNATQVWYF